MHSEHVILVGLSGCGKTAVGRRLSRRLERPFIDTDEALARRDGRSIPAIFADEGEQHFRELEATEIRLALAGPPAVISLGGGALQDPVTRIRCAAHCLVWLDAPPETLARRVAPRGDARTRPLLAGRDPVVRLRELLQQRRPHYAQAHLRVDARPPVEVVTGAVLMALRTFQSPDTQTLTVHTTAVPQRNSYAVVSGRGILRNLAPLLQTHLSTSRTFVVSNMLVWPLAGALVQEALHGQVAVQSVEQIPDGESAKTVANAERLWTWLAEHGAERRDPLLAFGGGVHGDLTGFVAATYLRGVPLVQIPTTLLAQVDSSIGGKVAVDHPLAKNMIGAFKAPDLVVVDTALLASLPPAQIAAGWAEVLKLGVILDAEFFQEIEEGAERLNDLVPDRTLAAVRRSLAIKAQVVEEDEFEQGPRMLLNYGHTIGHAIEAAAGYGRYLHGAAVSLGMVAAAWMAMRMGLLPERDFHRIETTLARLNLPVRLTGLDHAAILAAMQRDKKVRHGRITWVLPRRIGEAVRTDGVPPELPAAALAFLESAAIPAARS